MRTNIIDGKKIAGIRKQHQLTQAQLADLAGVHLDTVSALEAGRPPTMSTVLRICHALGIDPSQLERQP
jgi:transcriptional regulator with XRE-family HTH domain